MKNSIEEKFPEELSETEVEELVKQGEAIFFNYLGKLPEVENREMLVLLKGKGNAMVFRDLYSLNGRQNYRRHTPNWINKEESQEYIYHLMALGMDNTSQ